MHRALAEELAAIADAGLEGGDPFAALKAIRTLARRCARTGNPGGADDARALRSYRLTHWGAGGRGHVRTLRCADPNQGTYAELGVLRTVVYETSKLGDPANTEYEHAFQAPFPVLAYAAGGLIIAGGGYRVTWRGIVK